jgi:ribosomal protein S18 acetylase RimI-like enzyme
MTTVLLRAAGAADVAAIAEFQTACWREAYRGLVPQEYLDRVGAAERAARWHERLVSGARDVAIALLDDQVVGAASWGRHRVTRTPGAAAALPALELMTLYIGAGQRGTGLAARLLEHAIGQQPAYLEVFSGNGRAQAFYRKHGFRPDGHQATDPDTGVAEERYVRP